MKKLQFILLLGLLSCESTTLELITPDSISVGNSTGTMNAFGLGNKTTRNQEQPLELDIRGESESTMLWLEWDLPRWEPEVKYEGISVAQLERAIDTRMITLSDVEKAIDARMLTIADVEKAIDERMPKVIEVPIIIPPAETVDIEEVKEELKRELSPLFVAGFFAFLGLLGGVFLVSKLKS